ncbi:MAG: hypothetical protein ACI9MS_001954 [Glaciecola sp.]|jgi:hypothetical protein
MILNLDELFIRHYGCAANMDTVYYGSKILLLLADMQEIIILIGE